MQILLTFLVALPFAFSSHSKDDDSRSRLYEACLQNQAESIHQLILAEPFLIQNPIGPNRENALEVLSWHPELHGLHSILRAAKEAKYKPKKRTSSCFQLSALHFAAIKNDVKLFEKVCEFIEPDVKSHLDGSTPLHMAACCESVEVVKFLLSRCQLDPSAFRDEFGQTPLHYAMNTPFIRESTVIVIIELLIVAAQKDIINGVDKFNKTALDYAILNGSKGVVRYLMSKGALKASALLGKTGKSRCIVL